MLRRDEDVARDLKALASLKKRSAPAPERWEGEGAQVLHRSRKPATSSTLKSAGAWRGANG